MHADLLPSHPSARVLSARTCTIETPFVLAQPGVVRRVHDGKPALGQRDVPYVIAGQFRRLPPDRWPRLRAKVATRIQPRNLPHPPRRIRVADTRQQPGPMRHNEAEPPAGRPYRARTVRTDSLCHQMPPSVPRPARAKPAAPTGDIPSRLSLSVPAGATGPVSLAAAFPGLRHRPASAGHGYPTTRIHCSSNIN